MTIEEFLGKQVDLIDRAIQKYIPKEFDEEAIVFKLGPPKYRYNTDALNKAIAEPIWEFLERGGKRWRPSLFLLICEALGRNPKEYLEYAIIPEIIHNGTLMIDDIEDQSKHRRGKPCTYKVFGLDIAINAGNAMYYLPLLPLIANRKRIPAATLNMIYEVYVQEMINLSFGQAMDIAWHKNLPTAGRVDEAAYLQMCAYKTGTLARMSAKLAAILCGASDELTHKLGNFAEAIGVAFQIQDDILDLTENQFTEKKGARGMDITEGKRTLIVIHTLAKATPNIRIRLEEILKMHTENQNLRDEAISIMKKCGSIDYAANRAREIVNTSWCEIDLELAESSAKERLRAFAKYLVERKL
ncbi:MAG: polyprenyl synthetase family protein [Candidatus Bathyarchaeota archaeon]|jgi:geranylgeranyl pyrophosphate synthase|nr:MAG: polyprenyl synthetase family protein [Candidatus Bathyarchaeota archaeon]